MVAWEGEGDDDGGAPELLLGASLCLVAKR